MYTAKETGFSRRYLGEIADALAQPFCLMGGWSVYLTLQENFKKVTGLDYPGSRDIDLGFHLDPKWKSEEFAKSSLGKTIKKMKSMGFKPESFRFVRRYHLWEERALTPKEERILPQYDMFNLYIDVLVDTMDPRRFKVAGFNVLEEPLLARVFAGTDHVEAEFDGAKLTIPSPALLMEMKAKSLPDRTQDDKRTKDLVDVCGLVLYSGVRPPSFSNAAAGKKLLQRYERAVKKTREGEWKGIVTILGVTPSVVRRAALSI